MKAMRRLVAFVMVIAIRASSVHAEEATQGLPVQMAFQLGGILETESQDMGPAASMDLFWFPWSFGGIWSELALLQPKVSFSHADGVSGEDASSREDLAIVNAFGDWQTTQTHALVSLGIIYGGTQKYPGYLRGGIGAYHIENDFAARKVLANGPLVEPYSNVRWAVGANLAAGVRFAQPTWHMQPMFELRAHLLSGSEYDTSPNVMFSASGGFWFR